MQSGTAHAIRHDFFQTLLQMTSGQHADLTLHEPTLEQCWKIAATKSGTWFALACRSGARLATADTHIVEAFSRFGHYLGLLIQIGNDLDGLWTKPDRQSDLRSWPRWTLPVAYAMMVLDVENQERLRRCLRAAPTDPAAEDNARRIVIKCGAVLYLTTEAYRYCQAAHMTLVSVAPAGVARDRLTEVLERCSLPFPV